ncbi:glycosyltransferase family 2 protein [Sphingobacterium oryzagri]|uniref:Glycosyltransferase family 2 protein n=1 Tax=Sphingobacterium oryzagri TaxID=3025669 RepID=A0ABY7WIT0_9SPHI|nr:glycosyltransferase family 2 protein [Sphingobacterium sp. KACC 22765]WDF69516.1 glycosyltransferase family 2 protein [Sphingobacterium sp. KACC 22765]
MLASIIISTYNAPEWLEKVLIGFSVQTIRDFEVIIADDGSTAETKAVIDSFKHQFHNLKHVWHPDDGFRKCEILNLAIKASESAYLIFTDGDCIPRADFVETHLKKREVNKFLSGGYLKLPMVVSKAITKEDILRQDCFSPEWLVSKGLVKSFKNIKLYTNTILRWLLNSFTPTSPTWNGHNASGWKKDIVDVNGFDERMKYGGEDRELGERMINSGIKGKQIRYHAICIHLDHARGYVNDRDWEINNKIRKETKLNLAKTTRYGINK